MLSSDLQKLSVTGLVTLYELDATKLGAGVMRWHGHMSHEDWEFIYRYTDKSRYTDMTRHTDPTGTKDIIRRDIIWAGQEYKPVAIQSDGLEVRGDGRPSMPTLVIANQIDNTPGAITLLCAYHNDFVGATLKVTHVLAKYLDAANFTAGNPTANPSESTTQYWYVEQKTEENEQTVTFELASPLSAQRKKIPTRNITPYCTWAVRGQYRGESCRYMGAAMFTEDGTPTDNPALDKCGGRYIKDCQPRFGEGNPTNFGGFVSSQLRSR